MNNSASSSDARRHEPHSVALQDMRPYALGTELLDDETPHRGGSRRFARRHAGGADFFFHRGLLLRGRSRLRAQRSHLSRQPGDLFLAFGQQTFSEIHFSPGFSAQAIFQNLAFVQETLMSMTQLWPYLLSLMEQPVLSLDEAEKALVVADLLRLARPHA